jgi:hypothetical protein
MEFESLLDFASSLNEAEKARHAQRGEGELARLTVPEQLDDVSRAVLCLKSGSPSQRQAGLDNTLRLLAAARGGSETDALLPVVCGLLTSPVELAQPERVALLKLLSSICRARCLPPAVISARVLPVPLKLLGLAPPPAAGGTSEDIGIAAVECVEAAMDAGGVPHSTVVGDIVPRALALASSTLAWQRCMAARLMTAVLSQAPEAGTASCPYIDPLLELCQDVDSSVRRRMSTLLAVVIPAVSGKRGAVDLPDTPLSAAGAQLRDRCVEELCELLDDEDASVRDAAVETAAALLDGTRSGIPAVARRSRLLPRMRRLWESAGGGDSGSHAGSDEKDRQLRHALAENVGVLLFSGLTQGDMGPPAVTAPDIPPSGSASPRSRRSSVTASSGGAAAPPRRRSSIMRRWNGDDGLLGLSLPGSLLVSLLAFAQSLSQRPDIASRLSIARELPGMFLACLQTLGPLRLPAASGGPVAVAAMHSSAVGTSGPLTPTRSATRISMMLLPRALTGEKEVFATARLATQAAAQEDAVNATDAVLLSPSRSGADASELSSRPGACTVAVRDTLLPCLFRLAVDPSPNVRVCIARGLPHIAAGLGHERASRLLPPLYMLLLQDSCDEVVGEVIDTAHAWLAHLCAPEMGVRLLTYAALAPLIFVLGSKAVVTGSWRRQLSLLAALRLLPLLLPAPHVTEGALTVALGYIASASTAKPVLASAVHTLVWLSRHSPVGRVRVLIRDFLAGRMGSARVMRDAVATLLVQLQHASGGAWLAAPGVASLAEAGEGVVMGGSMSNRGRAPPPLSAGGDTSSAMINVGGGYSLPLPDVVDLLTRAQAAPPPGTPGVALELCGPAWRRALCVEVVAASLWVFSRAAVASSFLPSLLDAATMDATPAVRLAAVRAIPALRAWFVLPGDAQVMARLVTTLDAATGDSDPRVTAAARDAFETMRRMDAAAFAAVGPEGLALPLATARRFTCDSFSPKLRLALPLPHAADAPAAAPGRRRSSISSAVASISSAGRQGAESSIAYDSAFPDAAVRLASRAAALALANESATGRALATAVRSDGQSSVGLPPAVHALVDGLDALGQTPALMRNPFRVGITGQLPCLPLSVMRTAEGGSCSLATFEEAAAGDGVGLLALDDVYGLGTGITIFRDLPAESHRDAPHAYTCAPESRGEESAPPSGMLAPPTTQSLGRMALATGFGRTATLSPASSGPWQSCSTAWLPYATRGSAIAYQALQCVCPAPHSRAEEAARVAEEAAAFASSRAEEDAERRRVIEERKRDKEVRPPFADPKGGDKMAAAGDTSVPFSPAGWSTAVGAVAALLAAAPPRPFATLFPTAMELLAAHAPAQQMALLPAVASPPHAVSIVTGGVTISANGPSAGLGLVFSAPGMAPPGGASHGGSTFVRGLSSGSSPRLVPMQAPHDPFGAARTGSATARQTVKSASGGGAAPAPRIACFMASASVTTVTPASLSSLLVAIQPALHAHPKAVLLAPPLLLAGVSGSVSTPRTGSFSATATSAVAVRNAMAGFHAAADSHSTSLSARSASGATLHPGAVAAAASPPRSFPSVRSYNSQGLSAVAQAAMAQAAMAQAAVAQAAVVQAAAGGPAQATAAEPSVGSRRTITGPGGRK